MLKVVAVFVLSALSGSYTFAQSLNTWWEAPTADWPALHTIAFGNGTFVAAGKGDRYGRSLDGSAWVVKTFPSGVTAINDLHFANGMFMAVGDQGWILKSTDGIAWSVASANTQASLRAITFGNGRWAILGRASLAGQSIVLSSTDNGATWTTHSNAGFDVTGLGFGNGYFVASALAGLTTDLRRTSDLNQWSSGLNFDWGSTLRQVSYTPTLGRFVAVGDNGRILISQNGSSWSSAISSVNKHLLGIHWGNGECVAVGEQERIISSVDGQNWQVRRAPSESTRHLQDVVFGNGTWVAVGYDQADFWSERTGAILYSDGLAAGRLSFASATVSVPNASGLVEVEVKRTAGATGPLSVKYQTSDGTAVAGADYEASSGTLFWQDGDVLPQLIRVRILPANGSESAETFSISLSEPSNGGALGSPALVVVTIAAAQQGTAEWANRYPALQGERPNAMARGTNRLVAVGDNGTVATSNDGLSWIDRNSGTTQHLNGIAFGNGRFVAAGQGGVILWSHDGVEWMSSDSTLSQDLNEIAFANGKFVVVGAGGLIASSADGAQWNATPPRTTADLKGASFGGGRWLVTGTEGAVLISMDNAQSWELRRAPTIAGIDLGRNAFGNGTFAVLTSRGFHLTTADGVNWKPRLADVRLNTELSAVLNSISFIGEKFAIASSEGVIYTSSDAITWERQNSALEQPTCVATGFGSHVALAPGGGGSFSPMQPEWHQARAEEAFNFRAVAFGNGRFVAVADAGRIYVSENGVFWREHTVLETPALRTVVFGADQFVAAGDEGAIFTSPDGLEWTAQVSGTANTVHQVIFTGTHFYAATTTKGQVTSAVLRSRDAVAWEPTYTPGALTTLLGIAYGNGRYVVVGPANFSETSTDGVNFTSLSAPFSTIAFVGVTHGNGLFARARHQIQFTTVTEASIEISTDGRTWQKTWASAGEELNALTYIDGQFIALGRNGLFLVSNDGQNWIRHELGLPRSLHGVTQGPAGDWIVVGDRASIRQRFFSPFPVALKSELKLPISGASQFTDRILQLEATVAALGSEITQVEFYADDEIIGDRLTPPWRLEWRPLEPGQYRLTAVAYGKPGEVRQSPGVPVSIALLPEPPAILVQPKPATIAELTQHTLSIEASSGTPRSYQWFLNGNPIPHATEPSYTIANARAVSSGAYACEVSNAAGTIRSVEAIVTVTPHEGVPAPLWEVREYTPAFHDLNDVVWTGERFVAVGNRGAFAFSENGEEWRGLVYGGAFDNWTGLAAGLDRVIAGGDAGHMLVSDEGTNWVQMFSGIQAPITGVSFGNGRFLAVGQGNTIAMSMDGRTWTRSSYNRSVEFQGVIWFEGLFYAVGDNGALLTSPDGAIWTPRFTGTDRTFRAVAAGNGMLVAVGSEGRIFISHDGEIWENRTFSELATFRMAMFMEGLFVIGDNFGRIYASADGSNWQEQTSSTVGIHAGAYSPALGRGVYVGKAGMVAHSFDGVNWQTASSGRPVGYHKIVEAGGLLLAVGDVGRVSFSADGVRWKNSVIENPPAPEELLRRIRLRDVAYGADVWVAVGDKGNFVFCFDPEAFWFHNSVGTEDMYGVRFGNNRFVAVGKNGSVQVSFDGIDWQPASVTGDIFGPDLITLEFALGKFVAAGEGGVVFTSADGISWTLQNSGTAETLNSVRFLNGEYLAVGNSGASLYSLDAVNWRASTTIPGADLIDVAYGHGHWWLATAEGELFTTRAETGWIERNAGNERGWVSASGPAALLFHAGEIYVAGKNGQILAARAGVNSVAIIQHPFSLTATIGERVAFTVKTTGAPTQYQWFRNGAPLVDANGINGAQSATLAIDHVQPQHAGDYSVAVDGVESEPATLTVRSFEERPVYESFRYLRFDAAQREIEAISGPSADADGDGVANLVEYALGGNPLVKDRIVPTIELQSINGREFPAMVYQRIKGAIDLEFSLQTSEDLSVWDAANPEWIEKVTIESQPAMERVTLRSPDAIGAERQQFLRLQIRKVSRQ